MEQFVAKAVYAKTGTLRYTSHRDIIEIIKKAVVRSGVPVVYSQGFNPHPSLSFFNPLQLGIESTCEICVIPLSRYLRPDDILARLNRAVPAGMEFREVVFIRSRKDVTVVSSRYQLALPPGAEAGVRARLEEVVRPDFAITKDRNQKQVTVGDRITNCQVADGGFLFTLLSTGGSSISPLEFLKLFFAPETAVEALFRLKRKSVVVR
jgi:radical SAM-linked protein